MGDKDKKKRPGDEPEISLSAFLGGLTNALERGAESINRAAGTVKKVKKAIDEPEEPKEESAPCKCDCDKEKSDESNPIAEVLDAADNLGRKFVSALNGLADRMVKKADDGVENLEHRAKKAKKVATEIKETVDRVQKRSKDKNDPKGDADGG